MEQEVKKTSKSSKKSYFPMERLAKENRLQKKDTPKVKEEKKETKVEKTTVKETVKSTAKVLPKKPKKVTKPKEVIVDTHEKERLAKERKEKRALKLKEEKQRKIEVEQALRKERKKAKLIKDASKNEELAIKSKPREVKVVSKSSSKERVARATKTPFSYYYNASKDVSNHIGYVVVNQCMNDKFVGRIYQPQYFALSEQSNRIFLINELLISQALGLALTNPETNFVVQVSPKFLEKKEGLKKLDELFTHITPNVILCFDSRALTISGDIGRRNLIELQEKYKLNIMLDNPETERMSILFDYPIKYVRLDGRYFRDRNQNKVSFIKVVNEYCKNQKINLCAKYVDAKEEKSWMLANGVRFIEGNIVQKAKSTLAAALKK